jgi:hypothetical protein
MKLATWTNAALDALTDIDMSVTAEQRAVLVSAVNEINRILSEEAAILGESRGEHQRINFHSLLVVMWSNYTGLHVQVVAVRPNHTNYRR